MTASGVQDDGDDGTVLPTCLVCGARVRHLPPHLKRAHKMSVPSYRERFGIARSIPLQVTHGPDGEKLPDGRRRGSPAGAAGFQEKAARERERRARHAGYPSWEDLIRDTAAMNIGEVALLTGLTPLSIRRWRKRVAGPARAAGAGAGVQEPAARRERQAAVAGYASWEDLIRQTAHLGAVEASRLTGVAAATITAHRPLVLGPPREEWADAGASHDPRLTAATNYRAGCRCPQVCQPWRAEAARREREAKRATTRPLLEDIVRAVETGTGLDEAATAAGLTAHRVWSKLRGFPDLRERLLATARCQGLAVCGRPSGYRAGCRGAACREGHAREFRRLRGTSTQPVQDDKLQCLECGQWYRDLTKHLPWKHRMTPAEYRARHRLPPRALSIPKPRGERAPLPAEHTERGRRARMERQAAERDAAAATAGYPSWEEMIRQTAHLTCAEIAALAGVSEKRVMNHRRRVLGPKWEWDSFTSRQTLLNQARRRDGRAREAGYASWEELIRQTAHLTSAAAAELAGVSTTTINNWRRTYGANNTRETP